ncbi:hypothetical protein DFH28DRAFT_981180 [Melampsora americana]|nr:hypothetical protein DFH28DRAFT_981180 [Melampsora americana]
MSAPETRLKAPKTPRNEEEEGKRENENQFDPLRSLSPLFLNLSESIEDLQTNLIQLDQVCQFLDGFNQSFSSYLYGLRMSFYTTEFEEGPDEESLRDKEEEEEEEQLRLKVEEEEKKRLNQMEDRFRVRTYEVADQSNMSGISQTREVSTKSHSFHHPQPSTSTSTSNRTSKLPRPFKSQSKAQQKQLMKSTEPIMTTLPIKFREQQPSRQEMEKVICLLFLNPHGLSLKQIVKLDPTLALHRARECATALVAAKQATKLNQDGLVYRLNQG